MIPINAVAVSWTSGIHGQSTPIYQAVHSYLQYIICFIRIHQRVQFSPIGAAVRNLIGRRHSDDQLGWLQQLRQQCLEYDFPFVAPIVLVIDHHTDASIAWISQA